MIAALSEMFGLLWARVASSYKSGHLDGGEAWSDALIDLDTELSTRLFCLG